jgi:SAM-dependent methyltransferase
MTTTPSAYDLPEAPPWDIGRPQQAIRRLIEDGVFAGRVLDVGCGTGEHTLLLASMGIDVLGIDPSATAIARARGKSQQRNIPARFEVGSGLALGQEGYGQFDGVLDSGVFHIFDDDNRALYVENLAAAIRHGGLYVSLIFSDLEPPGWGPRRVTEGEIRESFAEGWQIESIAPSLYENTHKPPGAKAHLSRIRRT